MIENLICAWLSNEICNEKDRQAEKKRLEKELEDLRREIDDLKEENPPRQ